MGGEPGQILSFRKAAAGDFPTRKACWKYLAHEEYLADEQSPPLFFGPRHQERKSKTVLPFSSNAVLGTLRVKLRNQTSLSASVPFSPAVSTGYVPMATVFVCCWASHIMIEGMPEEMNTDQASGFEAQ